MKINMKRQNNVIILTLVCILVFILYVSSPIFTTKTAAQEFTDVKEGDWYYQYIKALADQELVHGYPDGSFLPSNYITRAELVKIMGDSGKRRNKEFIDVTRKHWAYEYIMNSTSEGYEDGTFRPDNYITRQEVVALLWRRVDMPEYGEISEDMQYLFKELPDWSKTALKWAYSNEIMQGSINDDTGIIELRPYDYITRAEASTLLAKFLYQEEGLEIPNENGIYSSTGTINPSNKNDKELNTPDPNQIENTPNPNKPQNTVNPSAPTTKPSENGGASSGGGGGGGGGTSEVKPKPSLSPTPTLKPTIKPTSGPTTNPDSKNLINLYTRNLSGEIVELNKETFLSGARNIYTGWYSEESLIIKNIGKDDLDCSLYISGGNVFTNNPFRSDFTIMITKMNGEVILEEQPLVNLQDVPIVKGPFNKGFEEEYIVTFSLVDNEGEQNYIQNQTLNFDFEVR